VKASGKCLCGKVAFGFGKAEASAHCHCHYCQRAHGAAFVTWVVVKDDHFRLESGERNLHWFQSSEQSRRAFCAECGSTLFFRSTLCPGETHVTRANLVGDVEIPVRYDCFVEQRATWGETGGDRIQLRGDSPALAKYSAVRP
jgi:hypothetical protein